MFEGELRRERVSRTRGFRHWRWHLLDMHVKLHGEMVDLCRAVDQEGKVLDSFVTGSRTSGQAGTAYLHEESAHAPRLTRSDRDDARTDSP
jgi:putative transposase